MMAEKIYEGERRYDDPKLQHCYDMGYFSKIDQPNLENCNFSLFSSQERKDAWQNGKKRALKELKSEFNKKMRHAQKLLEESQSKEGMDELLNEFKKFIETIGNVKKEEEILKQKDLILNFAKKCETTPLFKNSQKKAKEFEKYFKQVNKPEEWLINCYGWTLNRCVNAPFRFMVKGAIILNVPVMANLLKARIKELEENTKSEAE